MHSQQSGEGTRSGEGKLMIQWHSWSFQLLQQNPARSTGWTGEGWQESRCSTLSTQHPPVPWHTMAPWGAMEGLKPPTEHAPLLPGRPGRLLPTCRMSPVPNTLPLLYQHPVLRRAQINRSQGHRQGWGHPKGHPALLCQPECPCHKTAQSQNPPA